VRVAVAIDAGGGRRSIRPLRDGVEAVLVRGLFVGVALGACDPGRSILVRRGLHVLVAIDAGEHSTVDGLLHLFGVDGEADRLAIRIGGGERGVRVAGETVGVLRLVLGAGERCPGEQEDDDRQRTELARGSHAASTREAGLSCGDCDHSAR